MSRAFARQLFFVAIGLGTLAVAAACSDETIVLASVPVDDDAGPGSTPQTTKICVSNDNCDEGNEFCNLDHVGTVTTGTCKHRPFFCGDQKVHPVCGSNGVTYVNDCYRRQAGISSKTDDECPSETALPCDRTHGGCPIGATCELLGGGVPGTDVCGPPTGHCWGLIDRSCDEDADENDYGPRWDECSMEPAALRCVSSCKAIQSGRAFARAAFDCKAKP